MKHVRWMAVMAVMVFTVVAVPAQDADIIESHLGNEGPAFQEGMTPSSLGWGADDQAYPDRFVVYPQDGSELVWVPGGSFMMGNEDVYDEQPVHEVHLSGFWIGKTEVTVAQWRSVVGSVPNEDRQQRDDHPVAYVSWNDAEEFCEKTDLELPTDAQWEYAARGPESRRYPWGDEWDPHRLCWDENRGPGGRTFPVGSFPSGASWCGALDMSGNVWEWCADWYDSDYYESSPRSDPTGPSSRLFRVLRGGSWGGNASNCRSANRGRDAPDGTYGVFGNGGFRVARSCR